MSAAMLLTMATLLSTREVTSPLPLPSDIREHIDNAAIQVASEDESMGENIGEDTLEEDARENDRVDETQDVKLNSALYSRLQAIRVERIPLDIELIFERSGINGLYNIFRESMHPILGNNTR